MNEKMGPFEINRVHCVDCLEALRELPDGCVDLVLTDPPYGLNSKMNGGTWGIKYGMSSMMEWDYLIENQAMLDIISKGKNAIVWGGNYYSLPASRCWLVWEKPKMTTISDAELAWTNFDKLTKSIYLNRMDARNHPTEKPLRLMEWCVGNYSKENALICDPFSGVGTSLVAAARLGRRFLGFEINQQYCDIANARIQRELSQGVLKF